jgi:hypothetical protein
MKAVPGKECRGPLNECPAKIETGRTREEIYEILASK